MNARTEYSESLVSRCIDEYTTARISAAAIGATGTAAAGPAPGLEAVVNRMLLRCWTDGAFRAALGVALEARRLDAVTETLRRAQAAGGAEEGEPEFLSFAFDLAVACIPGRSWRHQVLGAISQQHIEARDELCAAAPLGEASPAPPSPGPRRDWLAHCKVLHALGRADLIADAVSTLIRRAVGADSGPFGRTASVTGWANSLPYLTALQVCFDVVDAEDQDFLVSMIKALPSPPPAPIPVAAVIPTPSSTAVAAVMPTPGMMDVDSETTALLEPSTIAEPVSSIQVVNDDDATIAAAAAMNLALTAALRSVRSILDGSVTSAVYLDFLSSSCSTDLVMLKQVKAWSETRSSVLHSAVVTAHGFMQAGTTSDGFLRAHLDWLQKAQNWAQFGVVASSGVVHRGNLAGAMSVLSSYLPAAPGEPSASPFAAGGALYALGLIHANCGSAAAAGIRANPSSIAVRDNASSGINADADDDDDDTVSGGGGVNLSTVDYLLQSLKLTQEETIQHGACLGLGLAGLGTGSEESYMAVREVLLSDNSVAGEAAGLALGLLLLGKGTTWVSADIGEPAAEEILSMARDSQKEKISRGIAVGLAFIVFGREETAEPLLQEMGRDKDAVLRYGAQFARGLAYAGTGNASALRTLLHVAVSDVSDDVRRAAVTSIGFLLARTPGDVPAVVGHLAESFNPHVRYGAVMAVGVACAGTGLASAIALLEPLLEDGVDFVRQGTLLALGLVLQMETAAHLPVVKKFRERLTKIIQTKSEGSLSKMGAILALGILDCGGRNSTVGMM